MKKLIVSLTSVGMIGAASAAVNLANEGDFSGGGASWGQASVGATFSFPATGGNTGGYGQADQTAGGWGGVLINDNDSPAPIAPLGIVAGVPYEFTIDLINLGPGTPVAGMKIEGWTGPGVNGDSTDQTFAITNTWETYTFTYTLNPGSDGIKFVPLMVGQAVGSSVGFDNVGVVVVPEPSSSLLLGLGALGLFVRRRR